MTAVEGTDAAQALDEALAGMARKATSGTTELVVGGRFFAASHVPDGHDTSNIYLNDVTSLRQGETMLRLFFDLPFTGMALTSPETRRWEQVNDRLCAMLGYSREELLALTWAEITHPDDLEADVAHMQNVLDGASDGYVMDKRFLRKDGAIVHTTLDIKALRDPNGDIVQFLGAIQDVTDQVLARKKLLRQRDLYAALSDTDQAIIASSSRDQVFQGVCRAAVERAQFRFAWIGMVDAASGAVHPVARHGDDHGYIDAVLAEVGGNSAHGQGPAGRAVRAGRHQIVRDVAGDPSMAPWRAAADREGLRAVGAFPLMHHDRVVGVFCVYADDAGVFDDDVVALLDEMAQALSFAMDNIEREEIRASTQADLLAAETRFRRAVEEAPFPTLIHAENGEIVNVGRAWLDISGYTREDIPTIAAWTELAHGAGKASVRREIDSHFDLPARRDWGEHTIRCKDGSQRIWAFSAVSLGRLPDGRRVAMTMAADVTVFRESVDRLAEAEAGYRGIVEQSLVGMYLIDGATVLYANQRVADILGYQPGELAGQPIENIVSPADLLAVSAEVARVLSGEVAVGKLEFMARRKDGTTVLVGAQGVLSTRDGKPAVLGVLQDVTERRRAEQEVQSYIERLQGAFMSTVTLATTLGEMRDPYTAGHASRVALVAAAIGEELGLDKDRVEGLRVAGQLHDIGKIKVPSELLSRPGTLMPAEFELIKYHAQAGYDVLKTVDFPWPVAEVAHQHHERIDGSGYPQGLKGDAICLEARIMAVADVVEAMASHRPYRPGLGIEKALAEIEHGRATLYDAEVADACLRLFREKGFVLAPA